MYISHIHVYGYGTFFLFACLEIFCCVKKFVYAEPSYIFLPQLFFYYQGLIN